MTISCLTQRISQRKSSTLKNLSIFGPQGAFSLRKGYSNQITSYTKDHLHLLLVTYSGTHYQGFKSHIIYVFMER